jgi:hypothetical protein
LKVLQEERSLVKKLHKRKMDEKFKKFDKENDTKKTEHGNSAIDHNEVFVVTILSMFTDDAWYVDSSASMHLFHRKIGSMNLRKLHQLIWEIIQHKRL